MDCQIFDYNKVLEDQRFFNSPFFDGVRDLNAVDEILQLAGFSSATPTSPRFIVSNMAQNSGNQIIVGSGADGRQFFSRAQALPFAYAQLDQPKYKADDGDKLSDMLDKFAKNIGKVFYFDSFGVAHYEDYIDIVSDILLGSSFDPLFEFSTNPRIYKGQQVFRTVTVQEDVGSVINHIKLKTNTPDWTVTFADDVNWNTIDNPNAEGFIGYHKSLYQQEGIFSSDETARRVMNFYKSLFRPPYIVRFQTYGLPIRALDIVSLNRQPLRIARVDSTISPRENLWWQQVECEWLRPITFDL